MGARVVHFVEYSCPKCRAELEAEEGRWQGWVRCPACDAPALPPEILLGHPSARRRVIGAVGVEYVPDLFTEDTDAEESAEPDPVIEPPHWTSGETLRTVFLAGLLMSLFLLLFAYSDGHWSLVGIFGALAFVFFLLLWLRPSRRQSRDSFTIAEESSRSRAGRRQS